MSDEVIIVKLTRPMVSALLELCEQADLSQSPHEWYYAVTGAKHQLERWQRADVKDVSELEPES